MVAVVTLCLRETRGTSAGQHYGTLMLLCACQRFATAQSSNCITDRKRRYIRIGYLNDTVRAFARRECSSRTPQRPLTDMCGKHFVHRQILFRNRNWSVCMKRQRTSNEAVIRIQKRLSLSIPPNQAALAYTRARYSCFRLLFAQRESEELVARGARNVPT